MESDASRGMTGGGTDSLRRDIEGVFRQVPNAGARRLWRCPDAEFLHAVRPAPAWWKSGYFGPAYQAIAARFRGPGGSSEADRARQEVDRVLGLAQGHFGAGPLRILDVPCGSGRHAREIAASGHDVIGIDLQPTLLAHLPGLPRAAADMRTLPIATASIDLVLNLWNSFGYFARQADEIAALAEFRRVLRPGGMALLQSDLDARAVAEGRWVQHMTAPLGAGVLYLQRQVPTPGGEALVSQAWVLFPGEDPWQAPAFVLRVLADADWEAWLREAGFATVRITHSAPGVVPHETIVSALA